ncbi:MAG TPA: hypothetical protein DCX07_10650 [Phycisphaerales bacterium]|nr:hypothetical protein [Phycisphaerales bacterium]
MAIVLKDIAKAAGVSVGTVSDILNRGRGHLYSQETRRKVLEASRRHDYRANRVAQAMRSNRTGIVGFATANTTTDGMLDNQTAYPFLVGLNKRLTGAGYHVGMVELAELEQGQTVPHALKERFYDALVIHYGLTEHAAKFARQMGLPLIWWDSGIFLPEGCICRDETAVSSELTNRLVAMGHRRITYMVGESGWKKYTAGETVHYSYAQRFEAYRAAMHDHGLRERVFVGYDPETCARHLADQKVTAMIIQGVGLSIIPEALSILGWRLGRELSVATLDREARMDTKGPLVGGMLYDRFETGQMAAEMVLSMLRQPQNPVSSVRIPPRFDMGDTINPILPSSSQ